MLLIERILWDTIACMSYELTSTESFNEWLTDLRDRKTRNKVLARLDRITNGNFGDFKTIDRDLFELRFFFGAGLRIYFTIQGNRIVLLLTGGDKSTQSRDIHKAQQLLDDQE